MTRENDQFQMFKRFKTMVKARSKEGWRAQVPQALLAVVSLVIANSPVPSMAAEAVRPGRRRGGRLSDVSPPALASWGVSFAGEAVGVRRRRGRGRS